MKSCCICLFVYFFVCSIVSGQTVSRPSSTVKAGVPFITYLQLPCTPSRFADTIHSAKNYTSPYTMMASDYYTNTLGFFCQKEIQIEKALKFPLRLRLGSVAYTDKMEGKGKR